MDAVKHHPSAREYLESLWRDYQAKKKDDSNFYTDRLAHLFFRG